MATPIANPVIVLGLDSAPLLKGLGSTVAVAGQYATKISTAFNNSFSNLGKSITDSITLPLKGMAILNQVMELSGKIQRIFGAPIRSAMASEQRAAQFAGTGSIDIATSTTFTGVLGRFQEQVEDTFTQIANSLDSIFNIKEKIEYFRGALAAIGAIFTAMADEFGNKKLDPKALSAAFKEGAFATINAFENAAKIVVQIANTFIRILNAVDAKAKVLGLQDQLAGGLAGAGEFLGFLPKGIGKELAKDIERGRIARDLARINELDIAKIDKIANAARLAVGRIDPNAQNLERKALDWQSKIGSNLQNNIQSRISPFLGSGTAQLEEALVKARVQAEGGDLQKRIEEAMREQIEIEKGQVNVLNAIKNVLQNKPGFLNVVGG